MENINRKMAKGSAWMILLRLVDRGLGLISMIILARLLVPADFGLNAMAWSIIGVLDVMGSFSFDLALIHRQNSDKRHYDTAWTYTILYGLFSAVVLASIAIPTAIFYNDYRLEAIMYVLAFSKIIQSFENIGVVAFQKEMNLRREFIFRTSKRMVAFIVTIALAVVYRNYWALVIGTVVSGLAGTIFSYFYHPFRPQFSLSGGKDLFNYSRWLLLNNIILFANNKGSDFIIGKFAGSTALGVYSISYEISNLPTTELVFPISKAVFPGYAKMAHDLVLLKKGFLDVFGVIVLCVVPVGLGITVLAKPIVFAFLGEKWINAVEVIKILALFGIIRACISNVGSVYLALGKPKILTVVAIVYFIILLPLLFFSIPLIGAVGAAYSFLIVVSITTPINIIIVMRLLRISLLNIVEEIWRPILSGLVMLVSVNAVGKALFHSTLQDFDWFYHLMALINHPSLNGYIQEPMEILNKIQESLFLPSVGLLLQLPILTLTGVLAYVSNKPGTWILLSPPL